MSTGLTELLGEKVIDKTGAEFDVTSLDSCDYIGIYFSAHWCPPCRGFTPILVEFYNDIKGSDKNFEIVFVSSDQTKDAYQQYFGTMPWKAIPFGDKRKDYLSAKYNVQGIPTFVVVDKSGELVTANARTVVAQYKGEGKYPWSDKKA